MSSKVHVYIDFKGVTYPVGTLWTRVRRGKQSATFEYTEQWIANPLHFALEPALMVGPGPFHTDESSALFGAIADSAPDRWGRMLMRRASRRLKDVDDQRPQSLMEVDYLLHVHDLSRVGALRFTLEEEGPYLAEGGDEVVPPLVELPRLLAASDRFVSEEDGNEDLKMLLAPGSSLGGAGPKVSVLDMEGRLSIAKFPSPLDQWRTELWEAVALTLAARAGIVVPEWSIEKIDGRSVLVLRRFDRSGAERIPFLSAMSMLGAKDHEVHCYLQMVDALRRWGASPRTDMHELFRRIIFNILISNTDDHLRNHAFLFESPKGWRLSPAYDLNPIPTDVKPRILSTEIDLGDATASVDLALSVAEYFELSLGEACDIEVEVRQAVGTWRKTASRLGLSKREIDRMASGFWE